MILDLDSLDELILHLKNKILNKDIIVLLQGDLASGKTTLVKRFVASIGIQEIVTSPTFSIQSIYGTEIYHYDLYNKGLDEFISLGMLEEFDKKGIHFVEWGDNTLKQLLESYGYDVLVITIEKKKNMREYSFA